MLPNHLLMHEFGQFGNYGSQLVLKIEKDTPMLVLENWAYGETFGSITVTEGINAAKIEKLGNDLIQAAVELKKWESLSK